MSTGAIFQLITNDGKQDRLLMATEFLQSRIAEITKTRGEDPTLQDLEKTHVLFMNAHFKPFAAIGYEYNKVSVTNGTVAMNNRVQFSIPQFGDFFSDMCLHVILAQPTLTITATADADKPLMRWCPYPGERLIKSVKMEVNSNTLDEYTYHAMSLHRETQVPDWKLDAWKGCVGQEVPLEGYVSQPNWVKANSAGDSHRISARVSIGNQTPSPQKSGSLEMFIPLLFWFNRDVRLAIPSVAIPYGQRYVTLELADTADLVDVVPRGASSWAAPGGSVGAVTVSKLELYINNIFVNPEIHNIYIKRIGFSLIRVHRQQLYTTSNGTDSVLLNQLKWPVETMFVGMKLNDYFNSSTAATKRQHLDKWHTYTQLTSNTYKTTGQQVRYEATVNHVSNTATIAIATTGVITGTNTVFTDDFAVGGTVSIQGAVYGITAVASATSMTVVPGPATALTGISMRDDVRKVTWQGLQVEASTPTATLDTITISAHGIKIYDNFPSKFFNAYMPYTYGGPNIVSPKDSGVFMIPFNLYPGSYQPSGHINVSRAREFYLDYTSSVIATNTTGVLVVLASALNFLLISDGSAVLRYST